MKIAFVTFEYPPFIIGGAGVYADNIIHELAKMGHKIVVFTPDFGISHERQEKNIKIIRINLNKKIPFKAPQFWFKLPKVVRNANAKEEFDIIHFNGLSYFLLNKILDIPHIITIHHLTVDTFLSGSKSFRDLCRLGEENILMRIMEKLCLNNVDRIIADSNYTKNQIINHYEVPKQKIETIYLGLGKKDNTTPTDELENFKKYEMEESKKIILFVGRVDDPRKNLEFLLRAFKCVLKQLNSNLIVVGKGNKKKAICLAKSLDILENVFFEGFVDQEVLKKLYLICDVYVCSSRLEGFGLTLLEAINAKKPIVATKVGSLPEIFEHYNYGELVELDDLEGFSNAIIKFLQDGTKRDLNLQKIDNLFNWSFSAQNLINLYKEMNK